MTVKQQAISDIKRELQQTGKSFIAFRTRLNPAINNIVKEYSEAQDNLHKTATRTY